MSESVIIYTALFAGFILLLLFIRFFPFSKKQEEAKTLMYYQLELPRRKISTVSILFFESNCKELIRSDYEIIFLSDLEAFAIRQSKLPDRSLLIAQNESYILKTALPTLLSKNITITIFIPIIVVEGDNIHKEKQVQQLNEFIFSEELKNIFNYTQPIC
jgi:reverse gyrase